MKKPLLMFTVMAAALLGFSTTAQAQSTTLKPDRTQSETAVYNPADNTVTVSAKAPTTTTFDWETYTYEDLTHIDSITVYRRTAGTYEGGIRLGRVDNPEVGKEFSYTDKRVETDNNYEYILTVYVDNLKSTDGFVTVYTGLLPGNVSNFEASVAKYNVPEVDITVTAPSAMRDGSDLAKNVSIDILSGDTWSGYNVIHTFENVEAGKTYTWKHTVSEKNATINYRAYARSGINGKGYTEYAETHVGLVAPGTPANFTATRQGDGVALSWEKPLKGRYNGDYDPANTTYKLTRVYKDNTKELVVSNISGYTYSDTPDFGEETCVTYELVAVNSEGESTDAAKSGQVLLGKALDLPFKESFANSQYEHKGWMTTTTQDDPYYTYNAWNLYSTNSVYYLPEDVALTVEPMDGDKGMATCLFYSYCEDGQTEALLSPHVNVGGADNVELRFYFWEMNGEATKNAIKAWVSRDDADWELLWESKSKSFAVPMWSEVVAPISGTKANKTLRIKIEAIRHAGPVTDMMVDNITLTAKGTDGIGSVDAETDGKAEFYTLSGTRLAGPAQHGTYIVRKGGNVRKVTVK